MTANQAPSVNAAQSLSVTLDRRRYRRVLFFFGRATLSIIWWEVVLKRIVGPKRIAAGRAERFQTIARDFRKLALAMGGVMIKLGQFISARVDVMPPAITDALADLQDEVPAEKFAAMQPVFEAEFGASPEDIFSEFDATALAAASLGQVYRAKLMTGEPVIVKIQRPEIGRLVATDLAALSEVARWAMYWPIVRKRADVPALIDEFARTLWQELDYSAEADNAEHFQVLFANDRRVYVPAIYRAHSTKRVITLEDVTSIKITDHHRIEAAGIDRGAAARHLLDVYLRMIFEYGFFHADPHPGNLFLYPLPEEDALTMYGSEAPYSGRPFYVVFVDFGMVGHITEDVKAGLREMLIAVGTRDAQRTLNAYKMLGVLLPSADTQRVEAAQQEMLDTVWGRSVPELAQMPRSEMKQFAVKYRDLLYDMPFQIPQDFIYLGRAVGMLSGICTGLDPQFNPWQQLADYAQKYVTKTLATDGIRTIAKEAGRIGQTAISLPNQLQDVLGRIQRGDLQAQMSADESLQNTLHRLEYAIVGVARAVVFSGLLVSATLFAVAGYTIIAGIGYGLAAAAWMAVVLRKGSR
jgi:predicted unusual protein kinase regulating ubiquinone biosynthesis (AarF/ABC1/UbiB family)